MLLHFKYLKRNGDMKPLNLGFDVKLLLISVICFYLYNEYNQFIKVYAVRLLVITSNTFDKFLQLFWL